MWRHNDKFNQILFTSIKFHISVKNIVSSLLGLGLTVKEIIGKFIGTVKRKKSCKVHVKKSATLPNIYYFTITFQGISLALKQFGLLFLKTGFINTYSTFKN